EGSTHRECKARAQVTSPNLVDWETGGYPNPGGELKFRERSSSGEVGYEGS
ncbi:hypothetical protein KI387_007747, partial [Taxus chinensis]